MDINASGTQAVVITTRSVYLFDRIATEPWIEAFKRKPTEFIGPGHRQEEAIGYMTDGQSIVITAEGMRAPVYRFQKAAVH
jgi:hypothetical protein